VMAPQWQVDLRDLSSILIEVRDWGSSDSFKRRIFQEIVEEGNGKLMYLLCSYTSFALLWKLAFRSQRPSGPVYEPRQSPR
jgi:hypothetical protein